MCRGGVRFADRTWCDFVRSIESAKGGLVVNDGIFAAVGSGGMKVDGGRESW